MKIKRMLALSLAALMLFAAGCAQKPDETSSTEPAESSAPDKENSKDPGEGFVEPLKNEVRDTINNLYDDIKPDRTKRENNLLKNHTPKINRVAVSDYPGKDGAVINDGIIPDGFDSEAWMGFSGGVPLKIDFDLGKDSDKPIGALRLYCLHKPSYSVKLPLRVSVDISNDGENYTRIATMLAPTKLFTDGTYVFNFPLNGTIKAKYIRFDTSTCDASFYFVGEAEAIWYDGEPLPPEEPENKDDVDDWYGDTVIPEITKPEYFDPSEKDFDKVVNLISGKKYQIWADGPIPHDLATDFYNTKEDVGRLTDGNYAKTPSYSDNRFFRFTQGLGRNIVFDLGKECAVSGFKASFLFEDSTGVKLPRRVVIKASQNGRDWQTIHTESQYLTDRAAEIVSREGNFDKIYKARYIKVSFSVASHIYCDEIEIYGTKKIPDGALDINADAEMSEVYPDKYITPDDFMGVNNMILSYHCLPGRAGEGRIPVSQYLPHVGYHDRDDKIVDTMFDSFLYLPYTAFNYSDKAKSFEGWKYYVDSQFVKNYNVDALNKAAQQVGEALDREVRCSVFFSILYTWKDITDFGDIDGDGISENFTKIEDRKKAIKWIIDDQIKQFKAGDYKNLDLLGFYWFEESINFADVHETELIKYASDYIHSLGYKLIWIPYYTASGYDDWKELGFDLACMQPNYAFTGAGGEKRVYADAAITKRLGMCVEMEIGDWTTRTGIDRYRAYMRIGAETGFMNAVKIYYTGGFPGAMYDSYKSKDEYQRLVYHETYLFAKGKYKPLKPENIIFNPDDITLATVSGKGAKEKMEIANDSFFTICVDTAPRYGTIRLNGNGEVLYNPFRGFAGKDEFKIYLDFNCGKSRIITVKVYVSEPEKDK